MAASPPSYTEPPFGPSSSNVSRRGTVSSVGSEQYEPMPVGNWILKFHGSCPRCHHQHNAVKIKVDVSQDAGKVSRVRCERCRQHWLTFGGRNSTRISLLSTITITPNPVESEVRSALINMVRSATAIASPVLSDIPETPSRSRTEDHLDPFPTGSTNQPLFEPTVLSSERASFYKPTESNNERSSTLHKLTRIVDRLPMLRKVSIKRMSQPSKKHYPSAKALGKRSMRVSTVEAGQASTDHPVASGTDGASLESRVGTTSQALLTTDEQPIRSKEGAEFLAAIDAESLKMKDKKALANWMRYKMTEFKSRRAAQSMSLATPMADAGSMTEAVQSQSSPASMLYRRSRELLGLGSTFSYSDGWWTNGHDHRPGSIIISEGATGDTTVVNDEIANGSGLQAFGNQFLQGERRRSGSLRPLSTRRVRFSWPYPLQPPGEARSSLDSTLVGVEFSEGRSNRLSQGSTARASMGYSAVRSQSSLYLSLHEPDGVDNGSQGPPSPPPLRVGDN